MEYGKIDPKQLALEPGYYITYHKLRDLGEYETMLKAKLWVYIENGKIFKYNSLIEYNQLKTNMKLGVSIYESIESDSDWFNRTFAEDLIDEKT